MNSIASADHDLHNAQMQLIFAKHYYYNFLDPLCKAAKKVSGISCCIQDIVRYPELRVRLSGDGEGGPTRACWGAYRGPIHRTPYKYKA